MSGPPSALLLLSGGIDSPVAGHALRAQGADVAALHLSQEPFVDDSPERKARQQAEIVGLEPFLVAPGGPALGTLARECEHRLYFVLQKRFMLRVASRVASERGLDVVATGENLGQVSSQTLENLAAVDAATRRPVVRPLLGSNKQEIVDRARQLGTYEVARGPEMCDQLGPDHPATATDAETVEAQEARVDIEAMLEEVVAGVREPVPA